MSNLKCVLISAVWLGLNAHAQVLTPSGPGPQPQLAGGVSNSAASGTTGPNALTPKWGEGLLELDFLRKLREFLETDPFDFKAFEAAFGVPLEAYPPTAQFPEGGWGIGSVRFKHPFGMTFNNRSRGGVYWSFSPTRNTSYVAMEFVKMPPAGKREGDGLPCIRPEQIKQVFDDGWVGETSYREIRVHMVTTLVPGQQGYKWRAETPQEVWMNYPIESCVPRLSVSFKRLPQHPAVK